MSVSIVQLKDVFNVYSVQLIKKLAVFVTLASIKIPTVNYFIFQIFKLIL